MIGDERVRFCGECAKNVYNLSAMTRDEAEGVLAEHHGNLCVRMYLRDDGTVMTQDCPVGVRRKWVRRVASAAGGALLAAQALSLASQRSSTLASRSTAMGEGPAALPMTRAESAPVATLVDAVGATAEDPVAPSPQPPAPPRPAHPYITGRLAVRPPAPPAVMGAAAPAPPAVPTQGQVKMGEVSPSCPLPHPEPGDPLIGAL
jgi:hypothetical protein